jgi:hypothetical protein
MYDQLFNSPSALTVALAVLAVLTYLVGMGTVRTLARQSFIERDDYSPPGPVGRARTDGARLALPFIPTVAMIALAFVLDRQSREAIVGGWIVMQIAALSSGVGNLLAVRPLRDPAAAEGHLRYSPAYRYASHSAYSVGTALFVGVVAALFHNIAFGMGCVLLLATALGYYRRAEQAAEATGTGK